MKRLARAAPLALLLVGAAAACAPGRLAGQSAGPAEDAAPAAVGFAKPNGPGPRRMDARPNEPVVDQADFRTPQEPGTVSPVLATVSSMVIPGMGQLLLGQKRWTAYAGLELAGWLVHLDRLRDGRRARATYRDLAWVAARGMPNPREESEWAYYEALGAWLRSGAYDLDDTRSGLQPEIDAASYNGSVWSLARDLYLPDGAGPEHPAYVKALAYYEKRAIQPGFLWDWGGREESQGVYRDLIHQSDEALRTATVVLGAVVANHLFATVDAFVSSRLGSPSPVRAAAAWRASPAGTGFEWRIEVKR